MRMFFSQLAVFGLDAQFFASIQGQPPAAIAQALDGRKALAVVTKSEYQGVEREQISGYKPALGGHGGGSFVPGLGGIGSGTPFGSSPIAQPSMSSFASPTASVPSTPAAAATAEELTATTSTEPPGELSAEQPSTPAPTMPSF